MKRDKLEGHPLFSESTVDYIVSWIGSHMGHCNRAIDIIASEARSNFRITLDVENETDKKLIDGPFLTLIDGKKRALKLFFDNKLTEEQREHTIIIWEELLKLYTTDASTQFEPSVDYEIGISFTVNL